MDKKETEAYEAGLDDATHDAYNAGLDDGEQAGINEVVEWVSRNIYFTDNQDMPRIFSKWQAKLKEWGIE